MNQNISQLIQYVTNPDECPQHNKDCVTQAIVRKFQLERSRSVYFSPHFAVRISYSKNGGFSNTILSLSRLQKFDHLPFIVILVSPANPNTLFLANTTFLDKISHSSHQLSTSKIRGSFNGWDIIKNYQGIENNAHNIKALFEIHRQISWNENLQRLVSNTQRIRTIPQTQNIDKYKTTIYQSIDRAISFIETQSYNDLKRDLQARVESSKPAILKISQLNNINIRGRLIEALISASEDERTRLFESIMQNEIPPYYTRNKLGDYCKMYDQTETLTDIKTKIIHRGSNPKGYNVNKFLKAMSRDKTVFFFFFVGMDQTENIKTALCSVYHNELVSSSGIQPHWSGRNSRGTVQFSGKAITSILLADSFENQINKPEAMKFLDRLMESIPQS